MLFDPGWFLLFLLLIFESIVLVVLVLPMPSNSIRGGMLTLITKIWSTSNFVRYLTAGLLLLNAFYFFTSMQSILGVESLGEILPGRASFHQIAELFTLLLNVYGGCLPHLSSSQTSRHVKRGWNTSSTNATGIFMPAVHKRYV